MHPLILPGGASIPSPALDLSLMAAALDSRITFTRASAASDALYTDVSGASYNTFLTDAARVSGARGLLIEPARTNSLLNSTAPVTQTTGSLSTGTYCLSVNGSGSAAVTAGTATITGLSGTASNGTYATFTVSVLGTVTVTITGSLNWFQLEVGSFPSSLIVTAGATATRALDTARMATTGWWQGPAVPFTMMVEFVPLNAVALTSAARLLQISKGAASDNDRFTINLRTNGDAAVATLTGASSVAQSGSYPLFPNVVQRIAATYRAPGQQLAIRGMVETPEATGVLGTGMDALEIATQFASNRPFCYVRRVMYWPVAFPPHLLGKVTRL